MPCDHHLVTFRPTLLSGYDDRHYESVGDRYHELHATGLTIAHTNLQMIIHIIHMVTVIR
jgi:hypothetical protein